MVANGFVMRKTVKSAMKNTADFLFLSESVQLVLLYVAFKIHVGII